MSVISIDISDVLYFSLKKTVLSHGWVNLAPFHWDNTKEVLTVCINLKHKVYTGTIKQDHSSSKIIFKTPDAIQAGDRIVFRKLISRMLSLEQDICGLEQLCYKKKNIKYSILLQKGWGRILKAPTVWEDTVKTICTTNASWPFTQKMCRNLCQHLGMDGAFPQPEAFKKISEKFLKEKIKLGYRSRYVLELAERIMSGDLCLEDYETGRCSYLDAERSIKKIKGLGPYGANHVLVLLGWNRYLPIDREVMKFLKIKQKKPNSKCPRETNHYKAWKNYRFIVYKLDRISKRENWIGA